MTAQTNDPLSSFAYPQTDGNVNNTNVTSPSPTPVPPTNDGTVQAVGVVTDGVNDNTQSGDANSTRGTIITGPDPVAADPSLIEDLVQTPVLEANLDTSVDTSGMPTSPDTLQTMPVENVVTDSATNNMSAPTPVGNVDMTASLSSTMPSTTPTDTQNDTPPAEVTPQPEQEEEHDSPLQALAKKLAKLREELIQEVPQEEVPTEKAIDPTDVATSVDGSMTDTQVQNESVDIQSAANVSSEDIQTNPTELDSTQTTTLDNPVSNVVDSPVESVVDTAPVADQAPGDPLASLIAGEQNALENKEVESNDEVDSGSSMSDSLAQTVPNTTPATSTLASLYPDVVSQVADVPFVNPDSVNTPTPVVNSDNNNNVLDENDNKMADPSAVEAASLTGKYPISINKIMDIAIERNASDIQVSVGYPVMIRIDGTLVAVNDHIVSASNAEELIMPVLTDQKKELLEVNREVDLAYSPLHNNDARFRINAYYAKGYLTAAFRLIPSKIRTIEELMLPPLYNQLINLSQGLVLVTGPTGHGKSTTLAAMLQAINQNRAVHMLTIEDPIEYMFKPAKAVVDQREMHDDTHSWTVALKSALRQDPDVILVGEMRDYETIASTITLAETGHLVFATLHTNSAAQTVDRIIDVFPENQQSQVRAQLSSILEAVIAQRLIPIEGGGRRAVSEIMLGNPAVRNLIREGKTHQLDNVIRTSADIGMVSLEHSLVKLVREGLITMDRAQEFAVHPEEVVRLLKG